MKDKPTCGNCNKQAKKLYTFEFTYDLGEGKGDQKETVDLCAECLKKAQELEDIEAMGFLRAEV